MICRRCAHAVSACTCPSGPVTTGVISVSTVLPPMAAHMTLRDWFAAKAMHGLMDAAMPMEEIAKEAYQMADLMLKAREK